jgi:hypothetical protein
LLAGEFAEKLVWVETVLERLASIDENHRDLVSEFAAQLLVTIHIYFPPDEAAPTFELTQGLLDNLAEVAPFARVNDHDIHICHMAFDLQTEHPSPLVHPDPDRPPCV